MKREKNNLTKFKNHTTIKNILNTPITLLVFVLLSPFN